MTLLDRLEIDGLPKYENRFFDLLCKQSFHHVTALSSLIDRSRKEIASRLSIVNESLSKSKFEDGWLRIDSKEKISDEVRKFRAQLERFRTEPWMTIKRERRCGSWQSEIW
jgi:uncharacterized protein YPO0396